MWTCSTLNPGEEEVSEGAADGDGQTEVDVERHEDEHQHVADCHLDDVKQRLNRMSRTHHVTTTTAATPTAGHVHSHTVHTHTAISNPTDTVMTTEITPSSSSPHQ